MRLLREVILDRFPTSVVLLDESSLPTPMLEESVNNEQKQLKHLHHLEDLLVIGGDKGFDDIISAAGKTHDYLLGKKRTGYSIQTKFDGSPSIIWGTHPDTGKFFVGTKSFFNKTPKINYSDKDIDTNHGSSPQLAEKLKFLLPELKKVSPKHGVYQGDLMYTAPDVRGATGKLSFQPNTLEYHVDKDSHEGRKILKSKVGIAAHTHYEKEPTSGNLQAVFDINMDDFKPSEDVHFLPTKLKGPFDYKSKDISEFVTNLNAARELNSKLHRTKAFESIKGHEPTLLAYINNTVKNKQAASPEGYISFLKNQANKKTSKLKTIGVKDRISKAVDAESKNVIENKKVFSDIFKAHRHIQNAKNVLVNVLSKNSPYKETILGNPSKPEGFVVSVNGRPIKIVDREHFSSANFDWNAKSNPEDNPLVLSFGRMNPPTVGHEKMIKTGEDIARRSGAKHQVVASRTQGPKDPLTPQQKIAWYKQFFPGKNVSVAAPNAPTLIAQLQHYHNQGVKDLTMVVGADRVPEFQNLIAKYNGEGKIFNFRRVRVISAGERDPDAEGVEGMSASKMRDAAKKDDFKTFRSGVPQHVKNPDAQSLFHDLKAQMGVAKITSTTPGHSLAIYANRQDKLGQDAKMEIERRKRAGLWKGA